MDGRSGQERKNHCDADARQRWFDGGEAQRERGANVVLTLDEKISTRERELAAAILPKTRCPGRATVMVMNPNTGEILALANWPKFQSNGERSQRKRG